jgi:hypothetical protein
MNEQAILDAYNLFVQNGYNKSIEDYKKLIASNPEALQDSYNLFVGQGYNKSIDDYKSLMGLSAVKKKEVTASPLAGGSSVSPTTEKLAVGPMGITGLERTKEYVPASDQGKQGTILNTISSLDRGFYKNLIGSPIKGLGTALEGATGKGFVSDALIKFGNYFNKTIDELTPQDEEFKNSLTDQFGQAFGQVASLIATGGAAGALGKGATAAQAAKTALAAQAAPKAVGAVSALKTLGSELASPTAVSAGLSMGQSEFERAKEAGTTDEQAFEAFYKNAAVGSVLEKIPVMQFLKRFEKASAGGISNYIKTKGVAGITGGIEEMTTEVLQGIYANLTAQDIYDANQQMFEGIGEAGGVGFGVGFLLNAMGANAKILRKQGREEEAKVVETQMAQFESQAAKGGVSSYKMGGIKIESPDVISKMIDNMDANDLVKANIEIKNDPELNTKLQNKIITSSIKEQVRQGNPELNETSLDAITNLELDLRKLEGNTTQTGKDKAAAIRAQIKNIQENQLTEEVDNSARIAELEGILSSADSNLAETGTSSLSEDARLEIEKELQTLKSKEDAIQKQTAGEVPVQPRAGVSETLEEGKPQAKPQVPPAEGVQEKVVQEEVDQEVERNRLSDKVFEAKKNIARASDTEAAIEEYNTAKKELDDFDASVEQAKDKRRAQLSVQNIIEDEKIESQKAGYEYKKLYDQDPRLAALQSSKDLLEFIKSNNLEEISAERGETIEETKKSQERSISYIEQNIADLEVDLEAKPAVSLKTQEVAPVTEAVLEIEQYEPITEAQVSHEKRFTKDNSIDYEEDFRVTDSGREVAYLSRVTVEAIDDNTGDAIGGLVKIVDEDKNVSWQAVDVDGNELGKQDFDSMQEAKTALVNNWNKIQKKEFDKEVKRKAKAAAKQAKKIYETLPTERVQPESGVVQPKAKAEIKPTGLAVPSGPSKKREEVKGSIQRIANAGLLRSAETGKPAITEQEIDVQMALTDAMASVWEETTGKNNFYETFISDVKEGDVEAIKQKGGALFQNTEVPQRPISRVTLGVFEEPLFQNMKGAMVAPQSISDFMKSKGKQIEKEIINNVLSYDKYKGQKRISFDEFRDDVETQIMKLERIDSKSYSDYGMDNLGDNHNYGKDQTIIFNSPIDHGQYGHFRGDFTKGQLNDVTWEVRQIPNTEQYVAIDADMPPGTPSNQIAQYVGTAGSLEEVNKWVSDRTSASLDAQINKGLFGHIRNWFNPNTGVYTLAELQSDYFQKNKANDLYASKISQDEVNEYVNKNFRRKLDNETTEAIKKEFGIVVDYTTNVGGDTIATATVKGFPNIPDDYPLVRNGYSESFVPAPGFTLEDVSENRTVVEALRILATKDTDVAARRREIVNEYEAKRLEIKKEENKYIAKRIEEIKKSEPANLMMSQFIASQKVHELRLFRESLKHAADKGATELWFPTPYTIAVIEGYVSSNGNAPYEVINGNEDYLVPGDTIEYGGTEMTVVESNRFSITVAPSDEVSVYDIDSLRDDETNGRVDELEYDLKRQVGNINTITREQVEEYDTDLFLSEQVKTSFIEWFDNNPEEEYVTWSEIEDEVRDYVADYYNDMSVEDLVSWAGEVYMEGDTVYAIENRRSTERLGQASEYESQVDEDDFEGDLSEEQYTVVKKYEELGKMIRKMRPDAEVVTDNNGKRWLKTAITEADASNPIIAFQEEGGKIKGAVDFSNDNKASIYIFDGADISTLAHEMSGHIGRRVLEQLSMVNDKFASDYEYAKKWAGVKDNQWSRAAEEKWARGFEKYLRTGKAPNAKLKDVFEKLRTWLTNIYKTIKGSSIDIKLTPEITRVFDNLLTTKTTEKKPTTKVQVEEEAGPTSEQISEIDALLDLDVEDEDNMQIVLGALDKFDNAISKRLRGGANDALLALPLSTVQLVVKTLKTLVKGGMLLRDAIRKVSADNNISAELVKDVLNISEIQDGFNELMDKVGAMIERQTRRGTPEARMISNIDTLVRNSEVYQNASDSQKKILEREARAKAGAPARRAPSIGRILGVLKDITNVSREDKLKIISQIRQLSKDAAKDLANEIRELAKTGKITTNQAANIIARFGKVNLLNEVSVSSFVDYMAKVFKNAEYAEQISRVESMLKTAKKNVQTKIGAAEALTPLLNKVFSIKPTMIPDSVFEDYVSIVEMIGERKTVLSLQESGQLTDRVNKILDAMDNEYSRAQSLIEMVELYKDKVIDEDGNLDLASTIKKMIKDKSITEQDAEIIRKYRGEIVPRETPEKKSEKELAEEKAQLVKTVKESEIDFDGLPMKDERDKARELQKLIKTDAVEGLNNATLNNLIRVIDNINNGYFPNFAQLMVERLNAINNAKVVEKVTEVAKPYKLEEIYAKLKSMITDKDKFSELVRRKPLYYIEQAYGNFKTKDIFSSIFEKPAQAQAAYESDEKNISTKLEQAEKNVSKSFNQNPNKTLESKFKMMTYMIQLEHDSNPNSEQVNQAKGFLDATIKHINNGRSTFGERDAKILDGILKNKSYQNSTGEIDATKLYNTFNSAEKNAIKVMQDINASLRDKAVHTASVIRGNKITPLNNYIHRNVLHEYRPEESLIGVSFIQDFNSSLRPSTRAESLVERTGDVSPLNFDVFASVNRGAKYVLMDYYLTEPIRTVRKTINETKKLIEKKIDKRDEKQKENPISEQAKKKQDASDKMQMEVLNSINNAFEEVVDNILVNNFSQTSFFDKVADYISRQGYRAVLASIPRFASELLSNASFVALAAPKQMKAGIKNSNVVKSADMPMIMKNVKSTEINRLYPHDTLSGRLVDTSILEQASGIKGGRAKNDVANKIQQIYNLSLKKYTNPIELMADAITSSPDKMVMRPLWYGSFVTKFESVSGKKLDEKKVAQNDEAYMSENKEAIDEARKEADRISILAGATSNPFLGVLKGKNKQNQSVGVRLFNTFNNFMTNFLIYEYTTARIGIQAAMGNGSLSERQGIALMAAVTTRMTLYTLLVNVLGGAMIDLFVDDEEEDDEKSIIQKVGQAIASSVTSIILGRDFGNATKAVINQGVEYGNEKFLDFLREGKYDPYKDAIQYTVMPPERKGKQAAYQDMIMNMMGPFGPAIKTSEFAFRKATEPEKKTEEARQRVEKEKTIRLPLEILGNLGMIPLYKDIRKIVNKEIYKGLENTEERPKGSKMSKEDMKKYFPDMYNQLYGPGGALYDIELIEKQMRKEKEKLMREMKDEMYNYRPK